MAMPGIEWRSKETPFRPFECLLAQTVIPDFRAAATLQDIEQLVIHMSFGVERAARRNLDDVHSGHAAAAFQLDVRAGSSHARPRFARQFGHIFDRESVINWNTFLLHPPLVSGFLRCVNDFVHIGPPFISGYLQSLNMA